jgi:simple sugar transport system ATP-binding protein
MSLASAPLLSLHGITKRYPGALANDDVALSIRSGEVLGVLGENGAGKSTLMHVLSGLVSPDAGEIRIDGRRVSFASPREAGACGIGMVHQHFMLVGPLTVEENLALGDPRWGRTRVDYAALRAKIAALALELGMTVDFGARVEALPVGRQQQIEILKTLSREPRVLILDEPTAVLPPEERAGLFRMIERLKARGTAVILISHKIEDIEQCCDRVLVMRQGRVVGESAVAGKTRAEIIRLVVGDDLPQVEQVAGQQAGEWAVRVEALTVQRPNGTRAVDEVSFDLHSGEILGLCGVEGNGQTELVQTLAGMIPPRRGRITYRLRGTEHAGPLPAARLRRLGVVHIAEDRLRHAVAAALSLAANWRLTNLHVRDFSSIGWLLHRPVANRVRRAIGDYAIKTPGPEVPVHQLSGGNQQKFVLARELDDDPAIVLAAHPTRGLDFRTMVSVKQELMRARNRGAAVLLVSADLAEIWEMADRVMVMIEGRIRGPVAASATTLQEVGHWMTSR